MNKLIFQLSLLNAIKNEKEDIKKIIEELSKYKIEFDKMADRAKYLQGIAEEKKKAGKEILKIDKILNSKKLLVEELKERIQNGKKLELSNFEELLQKERTELVKQLNTANKKMEPINFVKIKDELEFKIKLLEELNLQKYNEDIISLKIKELIKSTIEALDVEVTNSETKKEIIELIYKIRYYKNIPISNNQKIKELEEFTRKLKKIELKIITKACNEKMLNILSKDVKENYEITAEILNTSIINLKEIIVELKKIDNNTSLNVYDEKTIEKIIQIKNTKDLNLKYNKKIKLFN